MLHRILDGDSYTAVSLMLVDIDNEKGDWHGLVADVVKTLSHLPLVRPDQLSNLPIRAMHNGSTIGAFESWEKAITFIQSLSGIDMTELSLTFTTERI